MSKFRVESAVDNITGLVYAEIYFPDTNANPFIRTKPIFVSHESAEEYVIDMLKKGFPDKPVQKSN